jgi:hypothetical protein
MDQQLTKTNPTMNTTELATLLKSIQNAYLTLANIIFQGETEGTTLGSLDTIGGDGREGEEANSLDTIGGDSSKGEENMKKKKKGKTPKKDKKRKIKPVRPRRKTKKERKNQ